VPSLILNLLIIWFIGRLLGGQTAQRRRHKMAGKTEARSRRPPSRRVRRGLSGHLYQEEDDEDEIESIALEPIQNRTEQERIFSEDQELGSWQPATEAMAVSSLETAAQERATTVPERQPIDKLPAPSQDLLSPNNLVQSLILVQVLSEPRCRRTGQSLRAVSTQCPQLFL
jgi:hypothetical protein